jgi:hypothetical protein
LRRHHHGCHQRPRVSLGFRHPNINHLNQHPTPSRQGLYFFYSI